jgi:hypothetical protein
MYFLFSPSSKSDGPRTVLPIIDIITLALALHVANAHAGHGVCSCLAQQLGVYVPQVQEAAAVCGDFLDVHMKRPAPCVGCTGGQVCRDAFCDIAEMDVGRGKEHIWV